MSENLKSVLLYAKEVDKYVAVKNLVPFGLHEMDLVNLEDDGIVISYRKSDGYYICLTLKGYKSLV